MYWIALSLSLLFIRADMLPSTGTDGYRVRVPARETTPATQPAAPSRPTGGVSVYDGGSPIPPTLH